MNRFAEDGASAWGVEQAHEEHGAIARGQLALPIDAHPEQVQLARCRQGIGPRKGKIGERGYLIGCEVDLDRHNECNVASLFTDNVERAIWPSGGNAEVTICSGGIFLDRVPEILKPSVHLAA